MVRVPPPHDHPGASGGGGPPGRPPSNLGQYLIKPTNRSNTGYEMLNTEPDILGKVNEQYLRQGQLPLALQPKYLRKPEVLDAPRKRNISKGWRKPRSSRDERSRNLNYRQVGEYVKRANAGGGFTVKAYGPNAGTGSADKYMVGIRDLRPTGAWTSTRAEVGGDVEATTEQGMAFIEQRRRSTVGARRLLGWLARRRPHLLRRVASYPQTRRGERRHKRFAVKRGEEAIGTVGPLAGGKHPTPRPPTRSTARIARSTPPPESGSTNRSAGAGKLVPDDPLDVRIGGDR